MVIFSSSCSKERATDLLAPIRTEIRQNGLLQADFPDLKLVIVGDGPFKPKLRKFIASRGLQERVQLTGFIDGDEKIEWLQKAAVHLQSSYKEGWGLSVIEANACGCPVVANDTPGLRDSVVDGETGA